MKGFFATYGKVVDATVMVDRESGRSKGFGFVTFEDAQDTDRLVGKTDLFLDDKQVNQILCQNDLSRLIDV
jgi:RNA-binding protein Musashi